MLQASANAQDYSQDQRVCFATNTLFPGSWPMFLHSWQILLVGMTLFSTRFRVKSHVNLIRLLFQMNDDET